MEGFMETRLDFVDLLPELFNPLDSRFYRIEPMVDPTSQFLKKFSKLRVHTRPLCHVGIEHLLQVRLRKRADSLIHRLSALK